KDSGRTALKIETMGRDVASISSETPVLDRLRAAYNVMTGVRKCAELSIRPVDKFVHPQAAYNNSFVSDPFIPATHSLANNISSILVSALFDFAPFAFPQFAELPTNEKSNLVRGSFEPIHVVESMSRAVALFPNDNTVFMSYTMTLSQDSVDYFFSDCTLDVDIDEAKRVLYHNLKRMAECCKSTTKRVNPSEEELLALLALAFWNNDTATSNDSLNRAAYSVRAAIMRDLHVYYSACGLKNYATRIGELFSLLVFYEKMTSDVVEDIELFRLLQVYEDKKYY
ncbi:hypothetical protein PFISCL1PPCAC_3446, partial [Pristionchus fissidentatus]